VYEIRTADSLFGKYDPEDTVLSLQKGVAKSGNGFYTCEDWWGGCRMEAAALGRIIKADVRECQESSAAVAAAAALDPARCL
jgi:hypothetical protein